MNKDKPFRDYYKFLQDAADEAARRLKPMRNAAKSSFYDRYDDRTFNQVLLFMIDNMKEANN